MNNKTIYITFGDKKIENEFEILKEGKFEDKQLYNFIDGAIKDLKSNPSCGTKIPKGVDDMTMKRATRGGKLNGGEQKRNRAISRVRAPGERPFAVIKRVFNGGRTLVKTLERVRIKEVFKAFGFNIYQLVTLKRKELAAALQG